MMNCHTVWWLEKRERKKCENPSIKYAGFIRQVTATKYVFDLHVEMRTGDLKWKR